jgi:hypothetical protein
MKTIEQAKEDNKRFRQLTGHGLYEFWDARMMLAFKDGLLWLNLDKMEHWLGITDTDESIAKALERKYGKEARNIVAGLL